MTIVEFVDRVIDDGIAAARADYPEGSEKLRGSIAGFEACRGRSVSELYDVLVASATATHDAYARQASDYWWYRCYEAEVEWVANCLSVILVNDGFAPIVVPTARGVLKAAEIVGVRVA